MWIWAAPICPKILLFDDGWRPHQHLFYCGGKECYSVCVRVCGSHDRHRMVNISCSEVTCWFFGAGYALCSGPKVSRMAEECMVCMGATQGRWKSHCRRAICKTCCRRILCERPEGAQTKFSWSKERIPGFPGRRARRRVAVSLEDLVATAWQHAQ